MDPTALARLFELAEWEGPGSLAEMATTFHASGIAQLLALRQAVKAADAEGLRRAAHTLKGSSAYLGAQDMVALCRQLEAFGKAGSLADTSPLIARLEDEFQRVLAVLETYAGGERKS